MFSQAVVPSLPALSFQELMPTTFSCQLQIQPILWFNQYAQNRQFDAVYQLFNNYNLVTIYYNYHTLSIYAKNLKVCKLEVSSQQPIKGIVSYANTISHMELLTVT